MPGAAGPDRGSSDPKPSELSLGGSWQPPWGCGVSLGQTPSWAGGNTGALSWLRAGAIPFPPTSLGLPVAGVGGGGWHRAGCAVVPAPTGAAEGTSWSHWARMSRLQRRGCGRGSCARRVWGTVARGGWLRQGGREGGREAPALLCNFAADAVITGRAPPAWPAGGRQPHTQPPLLPGTPVPSLPPLPSLFGHGGSPLCTPGVWGAGGHGVPSTLQPTLLCACTL